MISGHSYFTAVVVDDTCAGCLYTMSLSCHRECMSFMCVVDVYFFLLLIYTYLSLSIKKE